MRAQGLRRILLVKAVEEHDTDASVLTHAEREAATRSALRTHAAPPRDGTAAARDARAWRVLEARAGELYRRLAERHPVVARTVLLESRATQAALVLLLVAFVAGLALSVVDARVRIEIVAFPLLGLVLWNLVVYLALAVAAVRRGRAGTRRPAATPGVSAWPLRLSWRRAAGLVRQASFYHRPLAAALRRFSDDWWPIAQPLLALQGKRLFHLGAAAMALGLVAGFYVRGIALEYRAGWESTFLDAGQVRAVLGLLYGPASAASGIALPATDAAIEALHWRGGAGGGQAAPWIHLIAVTALLFVVLPRLVLATVSTLALARESHRLEPPDALLPYAREVLGESDATPAAIVARVTPYAYRPADASRAGLERLLRAAYGAATVIDLDAPLAYGEEDRAGGHFGRGARGGDGLEVVLFTLASTPEAENHGAVLVAARDALAGDRAAMRMLALVDEAPFVAHARGDAALVARAGERRRAWRDFATRHGCEPCFVDLAALASAPSVPAETVTQLREAARRARA